MIRRYPFTLILLLVFAFPASAAEDASSNGKVSFQPESRKSIRLAPALIRAIALKHPRFAATLAGINIVGFRPDFYEVYWTPVPISSAEIGAFLNREKHVGFFKEFDNQAHRINRRILNGEISEIVYSVSVTQRSPNDWALRIRVENRGSEVIDPDASQLDIELSHDSRGKPIRQSWKIT